jgi:WD40 repeat protein
MALEVTTTFDREALLDEVVAAYLKEARAGITPDPEAWLARYPELAAELAEFFADRAAVERLAVPLRSVVQVAPPAEVTGDYELLEEIGRGGMGVVYRARQRTLNREVALKMVLAGRLASAGEVERFRQEAQAAAHLDHPNIVPIYEVGEMDGLPYFNMKLIDGGSLTQWLPCFQEDPRSAARLVATAARAVHHAHQRGILHRDLKPSNILLSVGQAFQSDAAASVRLESLTYTPYVTDFGLAKRVDGDSALSHSGAITGTPAYMAPEQAAGAKRLTTAVDVYGLGAILYEVLTGRPPFQGETVLDTLNQIRERDPVRPRSVRRGIPRDLETICLKCLDKEPARRYRSADALADDLERYLSGEPIQGRRTGAAERVVKWARRRPAVAGLALAVVALVGVVITLLASRLHRAEAGLTEAGEREKELKGVAEEQTRTAKLVEATLDFEKGATRLQQGDSAAGLLWLVRGLETAPEDAAELRAGMRRQLAAGAHQIHPVRAVIPHGSDASVDRVASSPDGKVLVTMHRRRLWLRDLATQKVIGEPLNVEPEVRFLAFSPDSKMLLVGCMDHLRRMDTATAKPIGEPLRLNALGDVDFRSGGFTPDGGAIYALDWRRLTIGRWNATTGQAWGAAMALINADKTRLINGPVFSRDGKRYLVAGSRNVTIGEISGKSGSWDWPHDQVMMVPDPGEEIIIANWAPDGKAVLVVVGDRVEYWIPGLKRGPLGKPLEHAKGSNIFALMVSPDGRSIYTAATDGKLRMWDEDTGRRVRECDFGRDVAVATTLSPDGRTILAEVRSLPPRLFDADTLTPQGPPLVAPKAAITFSADGRFLLLGCGDGTARLHEIRAPAKSLQLAGKGPQMVGFTDDGESAFAVDRNFVVLRSNGAAKWIFEEEQKRVPGALDVSAWHILALSPGGRFVLLSTGHPEGGGLYRVVDLKDSMRVGDVRIVDETTSRPPSLSTDGKTLFAVVVTPSGRALRRWEVATGKPVGEPLDPGGVIRSYALVDGGKSLLMAISTGAFRIERWDLTAGKRIGTAATFPELTPDAGFDVAFAPDGKSALVWTYNSGVRLWDLTTGKPRGEPLIRDLAATLFYSPDGKALAVRNVNGGEVRLWDAATLKPLGPPIQTDHIPEVTGDRLFAFSPDGKRCAAIVNDKLAVFDVPQTLQGDAERIRLWVEVNTGKELDAGGAIVDLKPDEWLKRWERLQSLGGLPVK